MKENRPIDPANISLCPACTNSESREWSRHGQAAYRRCLVCGTVFAVPRPPPVAHANALIDKYNLSPTILELSSARHTALQQTAVLLQTYHDCGNMLDIGCGAGGFFRYFSPDRWRRFGVEISPSTAQFAAETTGARVFTDLGQIPGSSEGGFDLVTMLDMVYHLDEPFLAFAEVRRLISPEGVFGVEIPGQSYMLVRSRGVLSKMVDGRWSRIQPDSTYRHWFSLKGLGVLLQRSGFNIVKIVSIINLPDRGPSSYIFYGYSKSIQTLARLHSQFFAWAPKVLILATPNSDHG